MMMAVTHLLVGQYSLLCIPEYLIVIIVITIYRLVGQAIIAIITNRSPHTLRYGPWPQDQEHSLNAIILG